MNNNKKIAVNTAFLYVKLAIAILANFIISRLVLDALGASDYGLYNVVGGFVSMLNVIGTSMVATSYRYLAVEIGKGSQGDTNRVYNTVLVIHIALAVFLLITGETIGVTYIRNVLKIDQIKIPDALFILHVSLITTAVAAITVPLNGLIIAREKFLFISIVESLNVILKVGLVISLFKISAERIRWYAIFLGICQLLIPLSYQTYCSIKEKETIKWKFNRNFADLKETMKFTGWILFGTTALVGKTQGVAMILNYFFGTVVNAAYGLASQVSHAANQFTATIRQAAIPQIMINQENDEKRSLTLVYAICRYSYLAMSAISIPLLLRMSQVLNLWLGDPPEYTKIFIDFMLISGMISNIGAGFDASIQATGKIRKNQIGYSLITLSILPIVYVLYKLGCPPYINVIVAVFITIFTRIFQIFIMKEVTNFSIKEYFNLTILPSIKSTIAASLPLIVINRFMNDSISSLIIMLSIGVIWTAAATYFWGITSREKDIIKGLLGNITNKFSRR